MRRSIEEAELDELETLAKLHGKDFKAPPKKLNVSKKDDEFFAQKAEDLQAKMQKRYDENLFKERIKDNGK